MTRLGALKPRELLMALGRAGYFQVHQRGSHVILKHPHTKIRISVPFHGGKDLPRPVVKKILREAGLTETELQDLL